MCPLSRARFALWGIRTCRCTWFGTRCCTCTRYCILSTCIVYLATKLVSRMRIRMAPVSFCISGILLYCTSIYFSRCTRFAWRVMRWLFSCFIPSRRIRGTCILYTRTRIDVRILRLPLLFPVTPEIVLLLIWCLTGRISVRTPMSRNIFRSSQSVIR